MMDFLAGFWSGYGAFLLKTVTLVVAFVFLMGLLASASRRNRDVQGSLELTDLSQQIKDEQEALAEQLMTDAERKKLRAEKKAAAKAEKQKAKQKKAAQTAAQTAESKAENKTKNEAEKEPESKRLFVVDFEGSMHAEEVESLRKEITAIISIAKPGDQVLVRLESPGGVVHGYGLAAAQLKRLRDNQIYLTVAVDKVAASGGYMMACIADKIVAAPFAILGSIGVVAQIPNFHRLLKKNHVDYDVLTAGDYKRTLTILGENTEKGREKFQSDLEHTHQLFKSFVAEHRTELDVDAVSTGEIWYGKDALEKGLVDAITTSDDLILRAAKNQTVLKIEYKEKKSLSEKLAQQTSSALARTLMRGWQNSRFFY